MIQTRALCSQSGEQERNRWLAGTLGLASDNQVHLIDYDEDSDQITATQYHHPNEIHSISACPYNSRNFVTCNRNPTIADQVVLWEMDEISTNPNGQLSEKTGTLNKLCVVESEIELVQKFIARNKEYSGSHFRAVDQL